MLAMAIAVAMGLQAPAWGAGLGRLTVQSALGQPLVAEVEITSLSREELGSLSAGLAPAEAFLQAGLDFRPALSTLRFAIDRRPDDRAFVRITSTEPVNEPFVDLLVELNWAAGRFVREYTFLLDPPELRIGRNSVEGSAAGSRVAAPALGGIVPVSASGAARAAEPGVAGANAGVVAPGNAAASVRAAASGDAGANGVAAPSPAAEQSAARSVIVQRGEVLASIAARTAPEGVAVEQAILAIYNTNPQAFFGNVHQMYAGRTLTIPDRSAMQSVALGEARRQIQEQTAAFNAQRERLAEALATVDTAMAEPLSAGSTSALPQEATAAAPAAPARDQLRLSSAAPAPAGPGAAAGARLVAGDASRSSESAGAELADAGGAPGADSSSAAPDAAGTRIAAAAVLRDQAARVTALEKSVADLQGLLQLKSRQLAELQQQVEARGLSPRAGAEPVASPVSAATDAIGASGAAGADRGAGAASMSMLEGGATQAAAPSASAASGARGSTTARLTSAPSAPSALAPDRERGFVDELLASPMTVPGLAAILVALGAYGWYTLRRRKSESFEDSLIAADAFTANSLFGTTGGQAVDTSDEAMFGASTPSACADVHATEVDPIAEAEVYIAYGRESQAEDILREALERQPERQAIRLKLLEMYAGRKDAPAFGRLAQEMYDMTGGHNEEWPKAAMLGLAVDPRNGLYAGGDVSAIADLDLVGANSSSAAGTDSASAAGAKFLSSLGLNSLSGQGANSLRGEDANSLTGFEADSVSSLGADPLSGFGANPAGGFGARKGEMEPFDTSAPIAEPPTGGPVADADAASSGRMPLHASWYHTDVLPRDFAEVQPTRDEVVSRETPALDFSLEMDAFGERTTEEAAEQFALADDHGELERAAAGRFDFPSLDFGPGPRGATLTGGAPVDSGRLSAAPERAERQRIERVADEHVDNERSPVFAELGDFRIDLPALEDLDLEGVRHADVFEAEGQALALAGLDVVPAEDNILQWQEMATKLDLASAYQEIGDKDGARELLEEVVRAGDAGQKHTAEAMLSKIA